MAQEYPVKKEMLVSNETPTCLIYHSSLNGWTISDRMKKIAYKVMSKDEWFKYRAGEIKHIFPEYDAKIHCITIDTQRPENLEFEQIGINLFKYASLDEKEVDLPYGSFSFIDTPQGTILRKLNINRDNYIDIGRTEGSDLYIAYQKFRNQKDNYIKYGRRAKQGTLFYGPPGNSKTTEICKLAAFAEENKFRVFFLGSNEVSLNSLASFKTILEKEDNVFVLEEVTERVEYPEDLLSFLDGEASWNNCFLIATTNHPEDLPWNIIDRPGRFKVLKEFGPPTLAQRTKYLQHMKLSDAEIEIAAKATEGLSMDYLINITFDALTMDEPILTVIARYKEERKKICGSFKGGIGIK